VLHEHIVDVGEPQRWNRAQVIGNPRTLYTVLRYSLTHNVVYLRDTR